MLLKNNLEIKEDGIPFKTSSEFGKFLNVLTEEELDKLEKKIIKEGCRDALVVWKEKNLLLDGYHRLYFCQKHNKPYKVVKLSFHNELEAKLWVFDNNKARRSSGDSPYYDCELVILEFEDYFRQKAKARLREAGKLYGRGKEKPSQSIGKAIHVDKELADLAGWSSETIRKVRFIMKHGNDSEKAQLRARRSPDSIKNVYDFNKGRLRIRRINKLMEARRKGVEFTESVEDVFGDSEPLSDRDDEMEFENVLRVTKEYIDSLITNLKAIHKQKDIFKVEFIEEKFEQYDFIKLLNKLLERINLFTRKNK